MKIGLSSNSAMTGKILSASAHLVHVDRDLDLHRLRSGVRVWPTQHHEKREPCSARRALNQCEIRDGLWGREVGPCVSCAIAPAVTALTSVASGDDAEVVTRRCSSEPLAGAAVNGDGMRCDMTR